MSDAVNAYKEVLNGGHWKPKYFEDYNKNLKATEILKYIFEEENVQSEEDARLLFTDEYISSHHLEPLVQNVPKVPELLPSDHSDLYWFIYPLSKPPKNELIHTLTDDVVFLRRDGFPKKYFYGAESRKKAIICFRHLCEQTLRMDRTTLKETFTRPSIGIAVLGKYKFGTILQNVFSSTTQLLYAAYPNIGKIEKEVK